LKLLHPVMPFVTEELWHKLPGRTESIMSSPWPSPEDYPLDEKAVSTFGFVQEVVTVIRTSRSELNVPPNARITVAVVGNNEVNEKILNCKYLLEFLTKIEKLTIETKKIPGPVAFSPIIGGEIYILLEGLIDLKAEKTKQEKDRLKLEKYIQAIDGKLKNEQFVKNAPPELVESEKIKAQEAKDKISRIDVNLKFLES